MTGAKKKLQVKGLRPAANKQDDFIDAELNAIQRPSDHNAAVHESHNGQEMAQASPDRPIHGGGGSQLTTTPVVPASQSRLDMLKQAAKLDKTPPVTSSMPMEQ